MKDVRISRDMALRLVKKFADKGAKLPNGDMTITLSPYGSKVTKRGREYFLNGYATDDSDVDKALVDVWNK